ncbi:MAG: hypothetical protein R3C11_20835 [Planctomycetaceae bacterium]
MSTGTARGTTPGANVVANYTYYQPRPAFVDRFIGRGRVLMLTTAIDYDNSQKNWSTLSSLVVPRAG